MIQPDELVAVGTKYKQGLEKLRLLQKCLDLLPKSSNIDLISDGIDEKRGEFAFWFAGTRYYVRIRVTDQNVEESPEEYRVPIGWLDWGRYGTDGRSGAPEQSNFFDERGVLCDFEKEQFYCNLEDCGQDRLKRALMGKLQKLVTRSVALNNAVSA